MSLRVGSLFAGYGGLDLGLSMVLDAEPVWFVEFDKHPSAILAHHWPDVPNYGDVTAVDWGQVEPVDILTGGYPCQPFSHAGKRKGTNDERHLWPYVADSLRVLRPRLAVFENVAGHLSLGFDTVLADLAALGFDAEWVVVRASDAGAPHRRERLFIVARDTQGSDARLRRTQRSPGATGRPDNAPVTADAGGGQLPRPAVRIDGLPVVGERGGDADGLTLLPTPAVNDIRKLLEERSAEPDEFGCRIWTGWTNGSATAYGKFSIGGVKMYAHRAAYEAYRGPIPEGYEIDHLCQQPLCVTPEHLDAVTPEENRSRVTQRRTHCKRGHEFTEENTYWIRPGARACRACRARQDKIQKQRKRGVPDDEIVLLPTPVTNDMGRGKTPQDWDEWTAAMQQRHGNGNGHGKSLEIEAQRHADFGPYTAAIASWEAVIGRPAPSPTEPGKDGRPRLSPAFVEWMMGLPDGWVTGTGIPRNAQLKALGNGVVPAQAALALSMLLPRLYGGEAGAVAVADDVRLLPTPTASLAGGEPAPWKPGVQWWRQSRATRNLAGIVTGNTPEWEGGST